MKTTPAVEPICLDAEVRPVPGFPGYAVSAAGDVYGPKGRRRVHPGSGGYTYVTIRRPGKATPAKLRVHTAVLLAFVGPKPTGMEGRHINGDSADNRASNLVWSTHSVNVADKELHGTLLRGVDVGTAKLTEDDVRAMRRAWPATSFSALARRFGVSKSTAGAAVAGKTWAHIS